MCINNFIQNCFLFQNFRKKHLYWKQKRQREFQRKFHKATQKHAYYPLSTGGEKNILHRIPIHNEFAQKVAIE